eukprot:TRINITY_DN17035_c0_g1_i1.p1 TRINITY_DN17035_c0_g1~~TRINITY_DN17035_c0_g1_i1.p1  ORF type:complete len:607 (+),score=55.40 TRINITY_DN17035_c0_g1_i1:68-1888(+)
MSCKFKAALLGVLFQNFPWAVGRLVEQRIQADASRLDAHPPKLPCDRPVQRKRVEFPSNLVLAKDASGLSMYSGYVNVTADDYLFYWFVEAAAEAPEDAPIVVWSNGGPGCSAMEGATTEIGPLILYGAKVSESSFTGKLVRNPYSWHKKAHLLFVDQPRYVGYSCGTGPYVTSSQDAGVDMVAFLRGWRGLFPERSSAGFVLASESYGGHYVPAWTAAILDHNAASSEKLPLVGIALGNALVNRALQNGRTFIEFARVQGLVPTDAMKDLFTDARWLIRQHLGYEPNYYDYRRESRFCCGCFSYNYSTWSQWLLREDVKAALHVCGKAGEAAFGGCHGGCIDFPNGFDAQGTIDNLGAIGRALDLGVNVSFYYGTQDTACDYIGGYAMASEIKWAGAERFAATPLKDLVLGGAVAGRTKSVDGLTWTEIEGAGHMAPIDNPAGAFFALEVLLAKAEPFANSICRSALEADAPGAVHLLGGVLLGFIGSSLLGALVYFNLLWKSKRTRSRKDASPGFDQIDDAKSADTEDMALVAGPAAAAALEDIVAPVAPVLSVPRAYAVVGPSSAMARVPAHLTVPLAHPLVTYAPVSTAPASAAFDFKRRHP